MPDGPWHAAVPVLAAAAAVTERVRLGTLVATPNFRHPVTLARDALALDDLSNGRLDLGLGPGSEGPRRHRARPGAVDAGGAPGALRGVPPGAPAHRGRGAGRADDPHDGALHGGPRHPARRERSSARSPSRSPPEGPRACGSPPCTATTGSPSAPPARSRARPRPRWTPCAASSPCSTMPAAAWAGTRRASAGCSSGRRPSRSSRRSTSSTNSSRPMRRARLRPVRAAPPGPDGAIRGRRGDVRADRRARRRDHLNRAQPANAAAISASSCRPRRRRLNPFHDARRAAHPRGRLDHRTAPPSDAAPGTEQRHLLGHQHLAPPARVDQPTMRVPASTGMAK